MDIGLRIKETVNTNKVITSKINDSFSDAIADAENNGVEVGKLSGTGTSLMAIIDDYEIMIPLEIVIDELKAEMKRFSMKDMAELKDAHIRNAVNDLIIKYLSL